MKVHVTGQIFIYDQPDDATTALIAVAETVEVDNKADAGFVAGQVMHAWYEAYSGRKWAHWRWVEKPVVE